MTIEEYIQHHKLNRLNGALIPPDLLQNERLKKCVGADEYYGLSPRFVGLCRSDKYFLKVFIYGSTFSRFEGEIGTDYAELNAST
jgi:hypothetical protein